MRPRAASTSSSNVAAETAYTGGLGYPPGAEATPLERAAKLRVPLKRENQSRGELADDLSTYVLDSAHARGELAEIRLNASRVLEQSRRDWAAIEGYAVGAGRLKTQADHDRAKATMDPELANRIKDAKWVISECELQMDRLDKDAIRCQAVYGIISGS